MERIHINRISDVQVPANLEGVVQGNPGDEPGRKPWGIPVLIFEEICEKFHKKLLNSRRTPRKDS